MQNSPDDRTPDGQPISETAAALTHILKSRDPKFPKRNHYQWLCEQYGEDATRDAIHKLAAEICRPDQQERRETLLNQTYPDDLCTAVEIHIEEPSVKKTPAKKHSAYHPASYLLPPECANDPLFEERKKLVAGWLGEEGIEVLRMGLEQRLSKLELSEQKIARYIELSIEHFVAEKCMTDEGWAFVTGGTTPKKDQPKRGLLSRAFMLLNGDPDVEMPLERKHISLMVDMNAKKLAEEVMEFSREMPDMRKSPPRGDDEPPSEERVR